MKTQQWEPQPNNLHIMRTMSYAGLFLLQGLVMVSDADLLSTQCNVNGEVHRESEEGPGGGKTCMTRTVKI